MDRPCARPGCTNPVVGRQDKKFCSDNCRFAMWRDEHLRCPNCGVPITVKIEAKPFRTDTRR